MKLSKLFSTTFATLTLLAASAAFAQVVTVPSPLILDPALSQAGAATQIVCDGPGYPPCPNSTYNGPISYTVTFVHAGLLSSSITPSVVDGGAIGNPANEFTVLNYTIFDPSATAVASNVMSQFNLAVVAGTYTITVMYTFVGTPTSASANWAMALTTGPSLLRVPEPGTLALLGLGLAALGFSRRKKG